MAVLYLEPFGGMAGDMLLASLLDLERSELGLEDLRSLAETLVPGEARLAVEPVRRGSLRALHLSVETPETVDPPHRHLADLLRLLDRAPLSPAARERAGRVLRRLAEAEARVHGVSPEEVHLHEVGAVDTLIDVCGAVFALERLGVERVHASVPYVGGGTQRCAHGEMPVPVPATAELLRGLPALHGPGGERLTPTGAALLVELVEAFGPPPGAFVAEVVGYGAGTRDPAEGPANLVRVSLGRTAQPAGASGVPGRAQLLEFNLDDATGEEVGFLLARLREAGALEAWTAPLQMKKERPGVLVACLCREEARVQLERVAFEHSPTLGVRWSTWQRTECERLELEVEVAGHRVRVQRRLRPGAAPGPHDLAAEYDDLAAVALATGRPLREVEREALAAARRL